MICADKLTKWLQQHTDDESHPEVHQLVKNLLIEMEFGAFDYEDDDDYSLLEPDE